MRGDCMDVNSIEERFREEAKKRIKERRDFFTHLLIFILINSFLIILNLNVSPDYKWFMWPLLLWTIGLTIHFFTIFIIRLRITEEDIQKEVRNFKHHNNIT